MERKYQHYRDEEGNVVATPLISVSSSGYWQVSYDNGQTYTSLGTKVRRWKSGRNQYIQ
ncbi:DUF4988 domain-containing protein [Bacteroides ovatus]|nr:DUF4988 domain-containing protein [Bacteroides ovatus]